MLSFSPHTIAERAIPALEEMELLEGIDLSGDYDAQLGLHNDGSAGSAHIRIGVEIRESAGNISSDEAVHTKFIQLPIGHYDPAAQKWKIYPDLINRNEWNCTSNAIQELAEAERTRLIRAANNDGGRFIDLQHPATQEARQMVNKYLLKSGIARRIIE